jgi:hypothetical protein
MARTVPPLQYGPPVTCRDKKKLHGASRSALVLAARLNPQSLQRRADLETAMGHQFRADLSIIAQSCRL